MSNLPPRVWLTSSEEFTSFDPTTQTPGNPVTNWHVDLYEVENGVPYLSLAEHTALLEQAVAQARAEAFEEASDLAHKYLTCPRDLRMRLRVMTEASRAKPEQGGGW